MKMKSKIGGFWIAALLFMTMMTVLMLQIVWHQSDLALDAIELVSVLCIDFFLLWTTFDTWYAFHENHLEIKSACFCHKNIQYYHIQQIEETTDSYSSAALSSDRINITYLNEKHDTEVILISPVHKEEFIQTLKEHAKLL